MNVVPLGDVWQICVSINVNVYVKIALMLCLYMYEQIPYILSRLVILWVKRIVV